ncbi:alkaline phosphatase family protein [Streptomyces sp. NBC_00285]|uniref:alkaline phosphatase family protein n=1 Tax=Streptomyces sp. NBC_00285 TaxID=2975700 RepID=UPI002E2BFE57|nr:alkaline phosphatase family protein [Streptomyces sp. NBC_00285]
MTVYWLVWDAAAHWIVDRLTAEGALPNTARLRAAGVSAAARPPAPNCQTPPSLATLFTGTWPERHGITGFRIPGTGGPVEESAAAFAPGRCAAPTVWHTAADAGLRTAAVYVPWTIGADGQAEPGLDVAVEAYGDRIDRQAALVLAGGQERFSVGTYVLDVTPVGGADVTSTGAPDAATLGSPDVRPTGGVGVAPVGGPDVEPAAGGVGHAPGRGPAVAQAACHRIRVTCGEHSVTLGAGDTDWHPLRLGTDTGVWLRLIETEGRRVLLRTGAWRPRVVGHDPALTHALTEDECLPVFAGEGIGPTYRAGLLGPRLVDGGDGTAEDLFLSSLACVQRSFEAPARTVLRRHSADLVVMYLPTTDDLGHELIGWCDPKGAAHRPDVDEQIWQRVRTCYGWADRLLGEVLDHAGAQDSVLLGADHGIAGTAWVVHPNEALIAAGLAARAPDGALDPGRSSVIYHPADNGSLWINHEDLPGGLVPRADTEDLLNRAEAALKGLTEPAGRPLISGFSGSPGCDPTLVRHVLFDPDCLPTATLRPDRAVVVPAHKPGAHITNNGDPRLHAVFAARGPGLPSGTDLGTVDNTLPAQIALRQLGLTPTGRSRPEPLARRACTAT